LSEEVIEFILVDFLLFAIITLAVSSVVITIFQIDKSHGNIAGYVLMVALALAIGFVSVNTASPQGPDPPLGNLLYSDTLGGIFALVMLFVTFFVVAASLTLYKSPNIVLYFSLLSFAALGMLLISYSADLLMLFVAWELMSLPTYVLAGFNKLKKESNEAAVKYAVLGALSSAIILYAISLEYGVTGTTQIAAAVSSLAAHALNPVASVAIILFVVGFGFKMSIVPFHMWAPDAYEGAPTPIATLFAAATKKAGFVAAFRVLLAAATVYVITQSAVFTLANVFAILSLLTMTLGNVAALTQKSLTRLLAYSSIAQAGYILIGFVMYSYASQPGNSVYDPQAALGIIGALYHVINHAIMKGAAFLVAGLIILKLGRGDLPILNGLSKRMPATAFTLSISLLALAGIPPLNGFWSKLLLFTSVLNSPFAWLAVAGVVNSALSMGYYAWIIKKMYLDEPEEPKRVKEPALMLGIFVLLLALIVLLGVFPGPVISFLHNAVPNIAGH
jgi:proton-translocating NADH-quinone oxidoreductase chain N